MEMVLALAIGVLTGSGVWLLLRPRTFQVIMGLALLSYAVNLFIFSMGRLGLAIGKEPVLQPGLPQRPGALCRPHAPGAGAHSHRHRLRHDGPVPGGFAGLARDGGHRPCGRHTRRRCGDWHDSYQDSYHDALPRSTPAGQGQGMPQPSPSGL